MAMTTQQFNILVTKKNFEELRQKFKKDIKRFVVRKDFEELRQKFKKDIKKFAARKDFEELRQKFKKEIKEVITILELEDNKITMEIEKKMQETKKLDASNFMNA